MKTRQQQKEKTRRQLIEVGLQLSARKGFSSLSLREVSQAAGISPAGFYRHFKSMEDLGLHLLDEVGLCLRQLLRSARRDSDLSSDQLTERSIEIFFNYLNDNPNHFRLLLGERQGASSQFRQAIHLEIDRFVSELTEDLERISKLRGQKLRHPPYAAEAIVAIVFTVGAEALDLPKHKQQSLGSRLVEEVNMVLRGALVRP